MFKRNDAAISLHLRTKLGRQRNEENQHNQEYLNVDNGFVIDFSRRIKLDMNPIVLSVNGKGKILPEIERIKPEGIPVLVIRSHDIAPLLLVFFRKSLDECTVPRSWKTAFVTQAPLKDVT